MVYNETFEDEVTIPTKERRMQLAIGAGPSNSLHIDGVSRVDLTIERPEENDLIEDRPLGAEAMWTDPTAWPSGEVPKANDTVTIDSGMNIIYNVDPTNPDHAEF
jgi:hypothetical protein